MTLREIAAISGKSGLYKILKPTRNGVIVETIDEKAQKIAIDANQRVSILKEISVYVAGRAEESVPLSEVLYNIKAEYADQIEVDTNESAELFSFFKSVLPDYDKTRVYASDIKKIISWYKILIKFAPETLEKTSEKETQIQTTNEVATSEIMKSN
jgi:hypothetical protein